VKRALACCAVLLGMASAGCGSSAVCGDGKVEGSEQCDDGNTVGGDGCSATCRVEATVDTFVHWQFLVGEFDGFDGETCLGVGAATVTLMITGPKTVTQTTDCSLAQIKLSSLPAGVYTVNAVALDAGGASLTMGLASETFTVGNQTQDVYVTFRFDDFTRAYTGTFYFSVRFGGAACAGAVVPVARERVAMVRGGAPLSGATVDGIPIDGSLAGACPAETASAQSVNDLPWGPATITITGEDTEGTVLYQGTFGTFVGAGASNGTAAFDLTLVAPLPDAPVPSIDAPELVVDAGVSD
jgi:cysteine-rich repeat protein